MHTINFIKQHNQFELAHMYEHAISSYIEKRLYEQYVFPYVDYSLFGHTIQPGIVYISLDVHSDHVNQLVANVRTLLSEPLRFSQDELHTVLYGLIAENERRHFIEEYETVRSALARLHSKGWEVLENIATVNIASLTRKPSPLRFTTVPRRMRELSVCVEIPLSEARQHTDLLPLFGELAKAILLSSYINLVGEDGLYGLGLDSSGEWQAQSGQKYTYRYTYEISMDLQSVAMECSKKTVQLWNCGGFKRLVDQLQLGHGLVPSTYDKLLDTGVLIGPKGWHETATIENCRTLLKHAVVRVQAGRKKMEQPLLPDPSILA